MAGEAALLHWTNGLGLHDGGLTAVMRWHYIREYARELIDPSICALPFPPPSLPLHSSSVHSAASPKHTRPHFEAALHSPASRSPSFNGYNLIDRNDRQARPFLSVDKFANDSLKTKLLRDT